jgi:hypothetical protein
MATKKAADVSIGKFDVLATYTYARALLDGADDSEAKERGMVAAIMGARAKVGHTSGGHNDDQDDKKVAEEKKKATITAKSFDHQVVEKMGPFFGKTFLPTLRKLIESGPSYEEVKRLLEIPGTWWAKISGEQFMERAVQPK